MMKKIFALTLIIGGLASTLPVSSQENKTYSLEECLSEAVKNNLTLRNADNQVAMSGEQRKEALTKYFPTISATGGGFIANKGLIEMDMGGGLGMSLAKNGLVAGVTAMQPIFAGGQIVNGNKLARVSESVSQLQRNLSENEIRLNTEQYYWQIVQLKEKLHTLDQLDCQLETARKDAQAAVDAGIRNRNDLLQVQLRQNELKFYQSAEASLPQTNEYQLLDKQVEAGKLQYKLAVGKNLPSVAVGGGYLYNDIMDKSQNRFVGMLTVSVPISSWWGGSHDMKRQKLQVANAENDKRNQSEMLIIRMRKAWNDLNDAYRQVTIAQESIAQSEENLRLNTDYYQAGTVAMSDLLDAQSLYQQSRDKYVESFTNYEVKKREYLQATGR